MVSSAASQNRQTLEKSSAKLLLGLAQSDRERECIKYAIFKASGMTATRSRRHYGFASMTERAAQVEQAIDEAQQIRETIESIARVQDKALLASFGIQYESSSSEETECNDECGDESECNDKHVSPSLCELSSDLLDLCKRTLIQSNFNWFEVQDVFEEKLGCDAVSITEKLFLHLPQLGFSKHQEDLVTQSKEAYAASQNDAYEAERTARVLNGCVVTESESDDPQLFARLHDPLSDSGRLIISKRQKAIRRRTRRLRAKVLAEQRFLSKKNTVSCSKILTECEGIGKVIEEFVSDHYVGADSWRRTGVLTFDGNKRLPQKVTYEQIRLHLQNVYK